MGYKVELTDDVAKVFDRLDKPVKERLQALFERLESLADPRTIGEALHGPLKGKWKYRAGEWRIFAEIYDGKLIVTVIKLSHRPKAY